MGTPKDVVANFDKRIETALALYDELVLAVHLKKRQSSLETMLAEQCVLGLAIQWESFIHDLLVSYIAENPDACIRSHRDRMTQSIESKNRAFTKWIKISIPNSLSRSQIESLLDPKGWNVTADSAERLAQKANQYLAASSAIKFSLAAPDRAFVDFLIAMRNYLSHRSAGALTILKARIQEIHQIDSASPLDGRITSVGAYLKATVPGMAVSRATLIGHNLRALAAKLV